jgi:hypothetical protein
VGPDYSSQALSRFNDEDSNGDDERSFAEQALKRARVKTTYLLTEAVAPTSNAVERLFSQARATIGLQRTTFSQNFWRRSCYSR